MVNETTTKQKQEAEMVKERRAYRGDLVKLAGTNLPPVEVLRVRIVNMFHPETDLLLIGHHKHAAVEVRRSDTELVCW